MKRFFSRYYWANESTGRFTTESVVYLGKSRLGPGLGRQYLDQFSEFCLQSYNN